MAEDGLGRTQREWGTKREEEGNAVVAGEKPTSFSKEVASETTFPVYKLFPIQYLCPPLHGT
jgi:hypothetical protein